MQNEVMYVQKESILSNINYVVWSRSFQIIYIYIRFINI